MQLKQETWNHSAPPSSPLSLYCCVVWNLFLQKKLHTVALIIQYNGKNECLPISTRLSLYFCHDFKGEKIPDAHLGLWVEHAQLQFIAMAMAIGLTEAYQTRLDAEGQVVEGLWTGNQVEGGR